MGSSTRWSVRAPAADARGAVLMGACPTLTTDRLVLRPFHEDDLDAYHAVIASDEVVAALASGEVTRADAWQQMASFLGQWELRGHGQWALEERASGRMVGRAGLHHPERDEWPGLEVGWTLAPDAWGRGYATEAGRAALTYAFDVLDAPEVVSVIAPDNTRSQAVARRLGLAWVEDRTMAWFPDRPLGVWRLRRDPV